MKQRIALVTDELPILGRSGGIGAAVHELALVLSSAEHDVSLYYVMERDAVTHDQIGAATATYSRFGIRFNFVDPAVWTVSGGLPSRSYAMHRELTRADAPHFDWVHFPDYHGLGFYYISAVTQGLVEPRPSTVVQLHGRTRWAAEVSHSLFTHKDQLVSDWMERRCIEWADHLVSPSAYMADYIEGAYPKRACADIRVIKNAFRIDIGDGVVRGAGTELSELVFFGRHEPRKGLVDFCDAVDRVHDLLAARQFTVTFLGSFSEINGEFSGLYLLKRAADWQVSVRVLPDVPRAHALAYLRNAENALIVVPSPKETISYTVVEALAAGRFVLTSCEGGARELLAPECRDTFTCAPGGESFAVALRSILNAPTLHESVAQSPADVAAQWLAFHDQPRAPQRTSTANDSELPLISVVITHYERPHKLREAIDSVVRQDYPNIELVVVDDGSTHENTVTELVDIEAYLHSVGGHLVRQENAYLGAARNRGLSASSGEFIIFLDDDDLALPGMVSTLVTAQQATGADDLMPLSIFMPEDQRSIFVHGNADDSDAQVSWLPLGGPLSLSPIMNPFGSSTALLRRSALESIGGYSELRNVGHEDHEVHFMLAARGADVRVVPEALFFYEIDRPSMASSTSIMRGHKRVVDRAVREGHVDEFVDLVSLISGRRAQELERDRVRWTQARAQVTAAERTLQEGSLSADEALGKLSEVARARGCERLAVDLVLSRIERLRLLHDRVGTSDWPHDHHGDVSDDVDGPLSLDPTLSLFALELATGVSTAESIERLTNAVEGATPSTSHEVAWVRLVPWTRALHEFPAATADLATAARALLSNQLHSGLLSAADVSPARAYEAWLTDAMGEPVGARTRLRGLILADMQQYSLANPDVAKAVAAGSFRDSFHHFVLHGFDEGRRGFESTQTYLSFEHDHDTLGDQLSAAQLLLINPSDSTVES